MKTTVLFVLAALALTGCSETDNPVERVRQQVTGDYPTQTRNFAADPRTAYGAARQALKQMGYRFERGGPAQGYLDEVSAIGPSDQPATLRQVGLHAEFQANLDGKSTDVTLRLSETLADDDKGALGPGSETPLRDSPLYDVIFRAIQGALDQPDKAEAAVGAPVAK